MRYPEGHKEEVHEKIVRLASEMLRRKGISGVSIPALMKRAGLTHGGFYGYFQNRDALVAAAVLAGAAETAEGVFADSLSLDDALRRYLSPAHVEHPEHGCVVAALGCEGERQSPEVRKAFGEVARGLLARIEKKLHPERPSRSLSDSALRLGATIVGAVVLARLVGDERLAHRILHVARDSAG